LWGTELARAHLTNANLIGTDTLYKSHGKIPKEFLQGCGLTDWEIEATRLYDPGLSAAETTGMAYQLVHLRNSRPFQYYSCFISYSTKDQEFAGRLYADLQAKGVRCWFAPHDIQDGRKVHEQIDGAIRLHDKLLLVLSEHSMASEWVGTEIANAREREAREKKQLLLPITIASFADVKQWKLFDADRGKDSAREIREYFIPDFSRWKQHD
jgi:TIR domain-containing protein